MADALHNPELLYAPVQLSAQSGSSAIALRRTAIASRSWPTLSMR